MKIKVNDIIKLIEKDGWFFYTQKGSHRQYKHPVKKGRVTINGKLSDQLDPFISNSILKQAALK